MLRLVTDGPREFYARDRNKIIQAACGLLGREYARPVDALPDVIRLLGYSIERRPIEPWSKTCREKRLITVCSNLRQRLRYPDSFDGVFACVLAHELAHIRLHLYQGRLCDTEADAYAGVFLVPRSDLFRQPAFQDLLSAGRAGLRLWPFVGHLAEHFGVTRACIVRQLESLDICELDRETGALRLVA
jgi:hypothetical protein